MFFVGGGVTFPRPVGGGKGLLPWIQIVITEWKEKTKQNFFFFLKKKKNFKMLTSRGGFFDLETRKQSWKPGFVER